jgi:hypothetical protein
MPRIKGVYGNERHNLRPDVLVNVWELSWNNKVEWVESYHVSELDDEWLNDYNQVDDRDLEWSDFGLEPCDECCDPINIMDAYNDVYISLIPYQNRLS